jgi:hypothetical protein
VDVEFVKSSFCALSSCVEVGWSHSCADCNCVEVGFMKSSHSGANCVEVDSGAEEILVRDSKDPDGPVLRFTREEWDAFTAGIRAGEML